ncbi:MAG: sensor histidine kinase [Planctomycetota bacterium]|jgi:signal transduction histidine kinase
MKTFEINPLSFGPGESKVPPKQSFCDAVLLFNAHWFTKVRWITVIVFVCTGIFSYFARDLIRSLGFVPPTRWPYVFAVVLSAANLLFLHMAGKLSDESSHLAVEVHLWLQIVFDLIMVTVLVYIVGSVDTYIPFTYLFHIILACIFFSPAQSFVVTLVAAAFYSLCVAIDLSDTWPGAGGILIARPLNCCQSTTISIIYAASAILVWFVVWFFVSTLSRAVGERDEQLREANDQLIEMNKEKRQQVLRTTHDLKAPFSGIESNIQVLKLKYWDETPESVRNIINRIHIRAQTLSERIRDILILGDLESIKATATRINPVDLQDILKEVLDGLVERAKARQITLDLECAPITVLSNRKQLVMLFSNIVANAVFYSHENSRVSITVQEDANEALVRISDQGIGISPEALPHIFEEYYHSKEGAQFNKLSTGLGLAIVRKIADNLNLRIKVESEQNKGTVFTISIPKNIKQTIQEM